MCSACTHIRLHRTGALRSLKITERDRLDGRICGSVQGMEVTGGLGKGQWPGCSWAGCFNSRCAGSFMSVGARGLG